MAEAIITLPSGDKLHTYTATIGANTTHMQFVAPDEYPYPTYSAVAGGISGATSSDHLMQLMAGSSLNVYVRRIKVQQAALITTANEFSVDIFRLSSAGTGGTSVTPRAMDTSDSASGATAMTLPTGKGTESGSSLDRLRLWAIQTAPTAGVSPATSFIWTPQPGAKSIRIPSGTSNGIALKIATGRAGLTLDITIDFVEMNH